MIITKAMNELPLFLIKMAFSQSTPKVYGYTLNNNDKILVKAV